MSHELDACELSERGFALERVNERLVLRDLHDERMSPLAVDFLEPQLLHRLKHGVSKQQPLSRALGVRGARRGEEPFVLDLTAGLGTDAFFIAALGCRLRAIVRSPVVAALLADGFERLRAAVASEEIEPLDSLSAIASRLSFERADATDFLNSLRELEHPDVIYMDPMYPDEGRSESALPKKAMQMFRRLIGDDRDAGEVFALAMSRARERVVVKRPLRAPPLGNEPSHVFEGKTARYDMYLVQARMN